MQKQKMELNKKGVSGAEISIAIIIITIGLSVIVSLFLIINKTSNKVNREIIATQLAKSILEKIKVIPYNDFVDIVKEVSNENYSTELGVDIPEGFNVEIVIEDKTPTSIAEAIQFAIRKEGNIVVKYMLSDENLEVRLPYVKYFDNVQTKNKPDLDSTEISSPNTYMKAELFEPVENDVNYTPVSMDDMDNWYNQVKTSEILARRKNTSNNYDLFYWEPRMIPADDDESLPTYLLGKTMYSLDPFIKNVQFPTGILHVVVINILQEKIGLPNTEDQTGKWVYIKTL